MKFTSFNRYYLDQLLLKTSFYGKVLDIGGKKINKRGSFRPPLDKVISWDYANMDHKTEPDLLCSAEKIPVADGHYDFVILTEVLEHVPNPEAVIKECSRVLKNNGIFILSIPFLYPLHADPGDFQRWTPEKIKIELKKSGMTVKNIHGRGGIVAVIMDLLNVYLDPPNPNFFSKIIRVSFITIAPLFLFLDKIVKNKDKITTGFFVEAVRYREGERCQ